MVFVDDEYEGVVGLGTIVDLIKEIPGDVWNEKDREDERIMHQISDRIME